VTLNDLIPGRREKQPKKHRAVDEVDRLRHNEVILLTNLHAAGDEIALLREDLAVTGARQAEAELLVVQLQADIDDLTDERDEWRAEVLRFRARFGAQLAAEANAHRIDVPPMFRDTSDPADQATGPIDVRPLREAAAAGLLGPVTNPGHISTSKEKS
jgi:hypothetical protein